MISTGPVALLLILFESCHYFVWYCDFARRYCRHQEAYWNG